MRQQRSRQRKKDQHVEVYTAEGGGIVKIPGDNELWPEVGRQSRGGGGGQGEGGGVDRAN